MIVKKSRSAGITVVEMMLVIVIGSFIVYMSIQQYLTYRKDADVIQVQANVDAIFQSLTAYYRINCYGQVDGSQVPVPGTLNPAFYSGTTPPYKTIDIAADLITPGYLEMPLNNNPIVKLVTGSNEYKGYVAQFNSAQPAVYRRICTSATAGTTAASPNSPNCTSSAPVGEVTIWQAQVAVHLLHPELNKQYLELLAGDCLSSLSGGVVTPCRLSGNKGDYVVWERFPSSNANTQAVSNYWETMPVVNQFQQMYTTNSVTNVLSDPTGQYYMCGN